MNNITLLIFNKSCELTKTTIFRNITLKPVYIVLTKQINMLVVIILFLVKLTSELLNTLNIIHSNNAK